MSDNDNKEPNIKPRVITKTDITDSSTKNSEASKNTNKKKK